MGSVNVKSEGRRYNIAVQARKTERLSITVTKSQRDWLEQAAEELNTSVSGIVSALVQEKING